VVPDSNPALRNGSFTWTYPGWPARVSLDLPVIERLRAELASHQHPAGLLIGPTNTRFGATKIIDFAPLPASIDPAGPELGAAVDEIAGRCPPDRAIAGTYRVVSENSIQLDFGGSTFVKRNFGQPSSVFVVITPDFVTVNSTWTSPVPAGTQAPEAAAGFRAAQRERLADWTMPLLHPGTRTNLWAKVLSAALVVALLATGSVLLKHGLAARAASARGSVALHVQRAGGGFVLTWDRSAPQIAAAEAGNLEIREGTKPLSLLSLTPEQLAVGTLTYNSYDYSNQAEFRLRVIGPDGASSAVSTASPEPQPASNVVAAETPQPEMTPVPERHDEPPAAQTVAAIPRRTGLKTEKRRLVANAESSERPFVPRADEYAANPEPPSLPPARRPSNTLLWAMGDLSLANRTSAPESQVRTASPPRAIAGAAGLLTITSEPSGATVEINNMSAGTTPVMLRMSPLGLGFTVTVSKGGFETWSIQSVATNEPAELHARLRQQ